MAQKKFWITEQANRRCQFGVSRNPMAKTEVPCSVRRSHAGTLAGSLMGCYLARAGYRVSIYERRPDPRAKGYLGGRSINLALSNRGLSGLAGAGLAEMVMNTEAIPMRGRMIHPVAMAAGAKPIFQPYSHDPGDAINSVSRGGLNLALIHAAAAYENVQIFFDSPCLDVDLEAPAAIFDSARGAKRIGADLILGADGAFSPVRARLQKTDRFDFSQSYLEHGYKELQIPAAGGGFALDPNALHIWPRGSSMMIALPNRDQSFTCTLFWPFAGEHGFESLRTEEEVRAFFGKHYPDAVPLMPTLHPAYLLRQPAHKKLAWRDLQAVREKMRSLGLPKTGLPQDATQSN